MKHLIILLIALVIILGAISLYDSGTTAGENGDALTSTTTQTTMDTLSITSDAFEHEASIPEQYSCDGENVNPPLAIDGVPEDAVSLVLIMDDPDVPEEVREDQLFTHWVLFNIDPSTGEIPENASDIGVIGKNTAGESAYAGPCPPTQYEPTEHRYFFRLHALDTELDLEEGATREEVERVMEGHIITEIELMGTYDRGEAEG